MKIKQKVFNKVEKSNIGRKWLGKVGDVIILNAVVGFFCNLLFAFYNGALGILSHSLWFVTMCAYYIILSTMRFAAVLYGVKSGSASDRFVMRLSGILLAMLSFVLTGVIHISLSQNIAVKYDEIAMITIATYTFYKITMAVIRAAKHKKKPSSLHMVIRNIGYAEVAASVISLQRSMIASFGGMSAESAHTLNVLTGAVVCLFVLLLGIALIIRSGKRRGE